MERKPLAVDLYAGLGGWTHGLLAEGYDVVGFDIERHAYGEHRYPAQLVLQDVRTIDGAQFKDASLIVASPPCQEFSYMAMPWTRAKAIAAALYARKIRHGVEGVNGDYPPFPDGYNGSRTTEELTALFDACFRIQREAIAAAGRFIPLVVENVRGAQPWVGRSRWSYGSYHLWGDVPALMPITLRKSVMKQGIAHRGDVTNFHGVKVSTMGAGWYPPGHPKHVPGLGFNTHADRQTRTEADGLKNAGFRFDGSGRSFQSESVNRTTKNDGGSWFNVAHNTTSGKGQNPVGPRGGKVRHDPRYPHLDPNTPELCPNCCAAAIAKGLAKAGAICEGCSFAGVKGFTPHGQPLGKNELSRKHGSKSSARKAASARIAKIPLPLAQWIAKAYLPK